MSSYIIKGEGIKQKLDSCEEVMDILVKMKENHPDFNYDLILDDHSKKLEWTIKININNEKLKKGVLTSSTGTHNIL